MTCAASISPRLISAVSPEPARLLAAAAAELADRWNSGNYDLGEADAVTDISRIRDALRSLAGLFDPESVEPYRNLYDWACELERTGWSAVTPPRGPARPTRPSREPPTAWPGAGPYRPRAWLVRHNGRPPLAASTLAPNLLMLSPGSRPVLACPDCGTWRVPRRGMLPAHRGSDEVARCPGSGQRVTIDLTPAEWQARLNAAAREAGRRRGAA